MFVVVFGGIIIVMCIYSAVSAMVNFNSSFILKQADKTTLEEMIKSNNIFEFKDISVVECYNITTFDNGNSDEYNFLIIYKGNDNKPHTASVCFSKKNEQMLNRMIVLAENDEKNEISFFARVNKFRSSDLYVEYINAVQGCRNVYDNPEISDLRLEFCFEHSEQLDDFVQKEKENRNVLLKYDVSFMGLGIILVVLGFIKRN